MKIQDLEEFVKKENDRIFNNYFPGYDNEKRILHAAVKANEEIGELCDATLKFLGSQRHNKMVNYSREELAAEVADSILTVSILASLMDIDVAQALADKMKKIDARYDVQGKEIVL